MIQHIYIHIHTPLYFVFTHLGNGPAYRNLDRSNICKGHVYRNISSSNCRDTVDTVDTHSPLKMLDLLQD